MNPITPAKGLSRKQLRALLATPKGKWLPPKQIPLFQDLSNSLSKQLKKKFHRHDKAIHLVEPLNNFATYPILMIWSLVLLVQFSLPALTTISIIALLLTVPLGLIAYKKIKKDRVKTQKQSIDMLALIQLKLTMIQRYITSPSYTALLSQDNTMSHSHYADKSMDKHRLDHIYAGIETGAYSTYTLFGTYYLGINGLLSFYSNAAIAATVMSPIGLLIGLGVCALVGIYFGFNQYQASREESFCKARIRELNNHLTEDEKILNRYIEQNISHPRKGIFQRRNFSQSPREYNQAKLAYPNAYQFPRFFARMQSQGKLNVPHAPSMLNVPS